MFGEAAFLLPRAILATLLAISVWAAQHLQSIREDDAQREAACSTKERAVLDAALRTGGIQVGDVAVTAFMRCLMSDHDPDSCEIRAVELVHARNLDRTAASAAIKTARGQLGSETEPWCSGHY